MATTAVRLLSPRDIAEARGLIASLDLRFEDRFDDLIGIFDEQRLIAAGARDGYVLKMLAVHPEHQGGAVLGELLTGLIRLGRDSGQETFFIFSRPENAVSFERHGFRLLVPDGSTALLEYGPGLPAYLDAHALLRRAGRHGAVVVNGNPFTFGHLHLVQTAASQVDLLYLFVVSEERSLFPFEARFRMASEATTHLTNVRVLETSRYAVSAGTFPSYFLKEREEGSSRQMETDLRLFSRHIAPYFSVKTRFVGAEPFCPTTARYNQAMARLLPEYGIALAEIPRLSIGGEIVTATRVRRAVLGHELESVAHMLPEPTLRFLRSADGEKLLAGRGGAHAGSAS